MKTFCRTDQILLMYYQNFIAHFKNIVQAVKKCQFFKKL